ncbi:MAG: SMP-30/gluconolactonase/LRE family protein [Acidobacteriota bacterium]
MRRHLVPLFLLLFLIGCSAPTPVPASPITSPALTTRAPEPFPSVPATLTSTAIPTRAAVATPIPSPTAARTLPPLSRLSPQVTPVVVELAKGFGGPDDLALMADGSILFTDVGNGTVNQIHPNGQVTTLLRGLEEPEGIVVLPDASLIIAEQKKNRLIHFRPNSGASPTLWLALENKTNNPGVDGLARDPATGDLIIPDSPNGRVLRVGADGKNVRVIASGMVRPTGADVERDGSILVADEYGNAVKRIRANGQVESLGHFATPDDVVVDAQGNILVASLGDDSIRMIAARTGAATLVVKARSPQGLVLDRDGSLIVAEAGLNRIVRVRLR